MKLIKKLIFLFIILMLIISFSNFNSNSTVAEGQTVVDMVGREVEVPTEINRIVTTYNTATQFIFALGAEDKLVSGAKHSSLQKLSTMLNPELQELPDVGSRREGVNLEQIIALQPDLVILFPYNDGPRAAEKLEEQGITSIIIKPEDYQQIKETNKLLGKVLQLEEKAKKINKQYTQILQLSKEVAQLSDEKKTVYFGNSHLLDTVGKGMLQTSLIELAGGINPAKEAKDGFMKISLEQLITWNPDVIILSQCYRGQIKELKEMPEYQTITAVREGKIYRIPSNLEPWDFPSPSSYLMIPWLSEKLYSDEFIDIEVERIVDDFYYEVYGERFSELDGQL
ncbi:ABC transporter substrate-binding protein [Natroniella acetigena]|uniref:ABC transporter substrate-binding protein n=1 Tax=Natroniella acetigena TaxID=52004 RepID=UPI00200B26D0|nr:ABC transporter substrate-binding protein [Natroniella acetigena]MCK8827284.1 ABC transporter substrate-binding protein [Natroniella acetigena]